MNIFPHIIFRNYRTTLHNFSACLKSLRLRKVIILVSMGSDDNIIRYLASISNSQVR